jgi:hypothetical protein
MPPLMFLASSSGAPGSASIVTYGPDGKTQAKQVSADFSGLQFASPGQPSGGQVTFSSQKPGEPTLLSTSSAQFGASGKPVSLQSAINDRRTGVPHRRLELDMSGLSYSVVNRIASGSLQLLTRHAATAAKLSDGAVTFQGEVLSALDLTHYLSDGSGDVGGYSSILFANAKLLGDQIVGGQIEIETKNPQRITTSNSKLHFTSQGLPASMSTDVFADNGTDVKASTLTDFSAAVFDPRRHIWSGQITATTSDLQGRVKAHTVVNFANGAPASAINRTFAESGQLFASVETDFTGAQFDNKNHVVNSSISVKRFRPDGSLLSSASVGFDELGNPFLRTTQVYRADGVTPSYTVTQDRSAAVFDHHRKIVRGQVKTTITPADGSPATVKLRQYVRTRKGCSTRVTRLAASGALLENTRSIHRPDGTLAETVTQTSPTLATITQYATDGKTVTKTYTVDYSAATVAGGAITGGSVAVNAQAGDQRSLASATLAYSS